MMMDHSAFMHRQFTEWLKALDQNIKGTYVSDPHHFFANLTWEQAREHLKSYTTEEIRQLLEEGAFGDRMTKDLKAYLTQRIIDPDFR